MSPTLEGRFLIAGPPGKSNHWSVWTNLTEQYLGHLYSFYCASSLQHRRRVRFLDQQDPLEKEIATGSSILAWEIPWTEKPGGL